MNSPTDLPETSEALFDLTCYPVLDIKEALKNIGDESTVKELLHLMKDESLPEDLKLIQTAYAEKNWDKVQQIAHKIKGGAIYVGTIRMKMACQYLERYWKTSQTKLLDDLYKQIIAVSEDTLDKITAWVRDN